MKYPDDFINKVIEGDCMKMMKDSPGQDKSHSTPAKDMKTKLKEKIKQLMKLGKKAVRLSDTCKAFEPALTITWESDGTISGEFYSYCLDMEEGGRHHCFEAENDKELEKMLDHFIKVAEKELCPKKFGKK